MVLESDWVVCQGGQQAFSTEAYPKFFDTSGNRTIFHVGAFGKQSFANNRKRFSAFEVGVWSVLHEGYLEFGAIKAIDWTPIFSHFHVAYITYLRSENMMGDFSRK